MVDMTLIIFGIVAVLAIGLGITLYRVVPCRLRGETIQPEPPEPAEDT